MNIKNQIIDDESLRFIEIYKITNLTNNKLYIGQVVSHILNHRRYRPHGTSARFRGHISEAFSKKKNQCHYLNNSIRKYGVENFVVEVLRTCSVECADNIETEEILKHNSLFPNGYNLKTGGKVFRHTDESKKRVSNGVIDFYKNQRFVKFLNVDFNDTETNFVKYIKPHGELGWRIVINGKKTIFDGVSNSSEENKKRAFEFLSELKSMKLAKHLDAGNS
jgi:hypothetical protein